jgi:tripeptidyl-peptidase-1
MLAQLFIVFTLLIAFSNALYTGPFIHKAFKPVVESRARVLNGENSKGTFIVALNHQNHEAMEQEFLDVSTPKSEKYGKHLSLDEMKSKYSPSLKNTEKVMNFFNSLENGKVELNSIGDMIKVTASLSSINEIMKTKVSVHSNDKNHRVLRSEESFHIPVELHSMISFVSLNAPVTVKPEKDALISLDTKGYYNVTATGGNTNVLLRFQVFCSDGELNNQNPPCAAQNDMQFTVYVEPYELKKDPTNNLTIVAIPSETDPYYHPIPNNKEIYCFSASTEAECDGVIDGSDCACVLSISPLPKYTQLRATIEVKIGNATDNSLVGQTNMFCLTDVATPEFLSKLYNMPRSLTARHGSNQSVAEFYSEFYSNSDLEVFFELTGLPNASIPVTNVYGDLPNNQTNPGGEAQLDVEYIMALAPNATTYFYSMSDLNPYDPINEGFINYLWVVGNQTNPPLVHSLSYGDIEANIFNASNPGSIEYGTACDNLFMAMGLRGLSVLFSSGDDGIGNSIMREDPELACRQAWPSWPASSPYVTTIGATVLTDRYLPACNANYAYSYHTGKTPHYPSMPEMTQIHVECTGTAETVCTSALGGVITSGGGFSNVYSQPVWQKNAVDNYLTMSNKIPTSPDYFNTTGRGYPDISTYGSNYLIYLNGKLTRESGTSASAPVFAAMVTLWNDMRLAYNKPPLGFIAPFLYTIGENTPEAFNDIVTGNNACGVGSSVDIITCCEESFHAAPGWDGSTGLGSPNFDVISNIVINGDTFFPTEGAYPDGTTTSQSTNDDTDNDDGDDDQNHDVIAIVALVFSIISILFMSYLTYVLYTKRNEESIRSSVIERNSNKI